MSRSEAFSPPVALRHALSSGRLGEGVSAKDMALAMCARLGLDGGDYQAIQYSGSAVRSMDMLGRMTLCNMAAELVARLV